MRIVYFIFLALTATSTIIFAIPGVALTVGIMTLGLGFIFPLLLPTLLIGLLSFLPMILLWGRRLLRMPALAAGFGVLASAHLGPLWLADRGFARDLAAQGDRMARAAQFNAPVGIEIHRPARPNPNLYVRGAPNGELFGETPCFSICERLLTGGDVSWVRIVLVDDAYANQRTQTHALLVPGTGLDCTGTMPEPPEVARCALYMRDHGHAADITLTLSEDRTSWHADNFTPYQQMGLRQVTARKGTDKAAEILFRKSQIYHQRPIGIYIIDPGNPGNGYTSGNLKLARKLKASAPIDIVSEIATLGVSLGPARPTRETTDSAHFTSSPLDLMDAARIASLLHAGPEGHQTYSNAFQNEINLWHRTLRDRPEMTATEHGVFCMSLIDSRLPDLFWKDQLIDKHKITCPEA